MIIENSKHASKFQLVFFATTLFLLSMFVFALPRISIPLSLAYILSLALSPMVDGLMNAGTTKNTAILILFVILAILVGLPLVKIIPVLSEESQNIHYSFPKIEQFIISQFEYF